MPQTEDLGIAYVHSQVAKMGFFFRGNPNMILAWIHTSRQQTPMAWLQAETLPFK